MMNFGLEITFTRKQQYFVAIYLIFGRWLVIKLSHTTALHCIHFAVHFRMERKGDDKKSLIWNKSNLLQLPCIHRITPVSTKDLQVYSNTNFHNNILTKRLISLVHAVSFSFPYMENSI